MLTFFYGGLALTIILGGIQIIASIAVGRHFFLDSIFPIFQLLIISYFVHKILCWIEKLLQTRLSTGEHNGKKLLA